jgi:hypothetical protein
MPSWYVVLTAFRDAENLITLDLEPIDKIGGYLS